MVNHCRLSTDTDVGNIAEFRKQHNHSEYFVTASKDSAHYMWVHSFCGERQA